MGIEPRSLREELSGPGARITTTSLQHHPDPRAKPPSVGNGIGPEHPHRSGVGTPIAVVLPAPLGPRIPVTNPRSTVNDSRSAAVVRPYLFTRLRTWTAGRADMPRVYERVSSLSSPAVAAGRRFAWRYH